MRPRRGGRYRARDRLRARFLTAPLDRALAEGTAPSASRALELRAQALERPSVARELGSQLRRIVREAQLESHPGVRVQACREAVLAVEQELRLLASRLQAANPVAASAVAKVRVLLTDGTGPLYYPETHGSLRAAVRDATVALD
jgi:hypothetical protein